MRNRVCRVLGPIVTDILTLPTDCTTRPSAIRIATRPASKQVTPGLFNLSTQRCETNDVVAPVSTKARTICDPTQTLVHIRSSPISLPFFLQIRGMFSITGRLTPISRPEQRFPDSHNPSSGPPPIRSGHRKDEMGLCNGLGSVPGHRISSIGIPDWSAALIP